MARHHDAAVKDEHDDLVSGPFHATQVRCATRPLLRSLPTQGG